MSHSLRSGAWLVACLLAARTASSADVSPAAGVRVWAPVTLDITGPPSDENAEPNPFRDVRLTVTFACGDERRVVPGYFAADGNAAESGAAAGRVWRAHFVPDRTGEWTYSVSLRGGQDVVLSDDPRAGAPLPGDGDSGAFAVADNPGADGMLRYVGRRYLQYAGSGRLFLKCGVDSPENFLAYVDFDGTPPDEARNSGRPGEARRGRRHRYAPHLGDWRDGDPTWRDGKGRAIVGAVNYLASQGVNSLYFLTMNIAGDGKDVWPYTSPDVRDRFDCSKLDQWDIVFSHLDRKGIMLHVVLTETENESLFEVERATASATAGESPAVTSNVAEAVAPDFADSRKLYYRELIARFAHHLALQWNIGEENGSTPKESTANDAQRENTDAQRIAFAGYIRDLDPYDHPIVVHTHPGQTWYQKVYPPLLGHAAYEGPSLQVSGQDVHALTREWVRRSTDAGRPWFVCIDEIGPADTGVKPDAVDPEHDDVRHKVLWANLMAGGSGCEWYFGYNFAHNDLNCEDFRSRENMYRQTRVAVEFFRQYLPFAEMEPADELLSNRRAWCLAKPGEVYAVYLPPGERTEITLPESDYTMAWLNPRTGGDLQAARPVAGGSGVSLGDPPDGRDWVALLRRSR
jgi:hypothetical protein